MRAATRTSTGRNTSPSRPATAVAAKYAHGASAVRFGNSASASANAADETSHTATSRRDVTQAQAGTEGDLALVRTPSTTRRSLA